MKSCRIPLWEKEAYVCPTSGDFVPFLQGYVHEEGSQGVMLIVPGGAYMMVAAGEGELVAKRFYREGLDTYVLVYTCALFGGGPIGLQPLRDLARAVEILRERGGEKLIICGFSAGAHLAASLGVHWRDPRVWPEGLVKTEILRPEGEILCYPVITTGEFAHKDSFTSLYGENPGEEQKNYASLEKNVTPETPPAFIWHTVTDADVPVENSLLYAASLKAAGVPFELHLFASGPHGYSLADDAWASGKYGGWYTMEQFFADMQYHIDEQIPMGDGQPLPPRGTDFRETFLSMPKDYLKAQPNPAVAVWPELAMNWLRQEKILEGGAGSEAGGQ